MNQPKITIGIPVFNEEKNISRLLRQIIEQTRNCETQIIVVSSGSTDKTNQIVKEFTKVQLIEEPKRKGKVSALKIIFEQATGDIIVMTDGDVLLNDESIPQLLTAFNDRDILATTARVAPLKQGSNFMYQLSVLGCKAWHRLRKIKDIQNGFVYPSGYLYAIRKNLINKINLDDKTINEDGFMGLLLYKKGIKFSYVDKSLIFILFPQTIRDFVKQKVRTRAGRRQYSDFKFFSQVEKEWRNSLVNVGKYKKFYLSIYYVLDWYCRIKANNDILKKESNLHLWETITTTKPTETNVTYNISKHKSITQYDKQQLKHSLIQVTEYFQVQLKGKLIFNWNDTAVNSKAISAEGKPVWLRIQYIDRTEVKNNYAWNGEIDAGLLKNISKSELLDYRDWQDGEVCWRAILSSYVYKKFCSNKPILIDSNFPALTKWLDELKKNLINLSKHKTNRVSVTQEDIDKKIKKTFNVNIDTSIINWTTVHGDLHWANLTYPSLCILDWDVWGKGPLGYDPALLLAFSADNREVVDKIRNVFKDWLSTRDGKVVQLFALAEVLNIARFDNQFSRLEKSLERLSREIIDELKKEQKIDK